LSFEPEPRCKHCGFDFSLTEPDLTMRGHESSDDSPLSDLRLRDQDADLARTPVTLGPMRASMAPAGAGASALALTLDRAEVSPDFPPEPTRSRPVRAPATTELPLFVKGLAAAEAAEAAVVTNDEPLVKVPPSPRTPLAVRRQPEAPRQAPADSTDARAGRKLGPFDHDLLEDLQRIEAKAAGRTIVYRPVAPSSGALGRRLTAGVVDLAFLSGLSWAVYWSTLRWCELPMDQASVLPIAPMAAFLLLMVFGYLFIFTAASGQTIGKMILGLRVVADPESGDPPTLRQASYRALLTVPSVLALGAGFLPALLGPGLTLHDRAAHTRVVRT
jgi:uncharacterized RDD family membrane protein YckC